MHHVDVVQFHYKCHYKSPIFEVVALVSMVLRVESIQKSVVHYTQYSKAYNYFELDVSSHGTKVWFAHCAREAPAKTRYSGHLFSRLTRFCHKRVQTNPLSYYMEGKHKTQ